MGRLIKAVFTRPYYLWKYAFQTLAFAVNYLLLALQKRAQANFTIGANPRVLSWNAFKAEKPGARIAVGRSIIVYHNCDILASGSGQVRIGDDCIIGSNFRLYCREQVEIGDRALISWNVFIGDYDAHSVRPAERRLEVEYIQDTFFPNFQKIERGQRGDFRPGYRSKPVSIGDDVWIGANATILKGVSIGSGAVIAAGAVVTRDIPANCVAAGNPAQVVKEIAREALP